MVFHQVLQIPSQSNFTTFEFPVDVVSLTDKHMADVWGNQVYRLSLNAKKLQLSGKYKITFSKN